MLILIRNELKENKGWFKRQETFMKDDSRNYKKIVAIKSDWKSIPQDTLTIYLNQLCRMSLDQLTFSAWQIFQNSEMIQKMTDKELVIRLTDCYFWINHIKEFLIKEYWDTKRKVIPHEIDPYKFFDAVMSNKEAVVFYTAMSVDENQIWNLFPMIDGLIDYTMMLLDKRGDFRYDMDEKDIEINTYIEARIDSVRHKKDTIPDAGIEARIDSGSHNILSSNDYDKQ
jgi:hypothetical protein